MSSVTVIHQQQQPFKKTSTPSGKRKIASVLDLENVENLRHHQSSPSKAAVAPVSSSPQINSSPAMTVIKKAFTGANVTVSALNNQANIINNQQPKARPTTKVHTPKTPVSLIHPSEANAAATKSSNKAVLPQAVARRNARERNRVKQVNNGFAALRQHIPEEMAEAFELQKGCSATTTQTSAAAAAAAKKLSKVETLRMAVEYIRNLESLLNISSSTAHANDHSFSFCDTSSLVSNSPSSPSYSNSSMIDEEPSLHPLPPMIPYDTEPIDQSHVVLPSVTTINGIPYLRLPPNQTHLSGAQGYIDQASGDFVLVSTGIEDQLQLQQQQEQLAYQMDQRQPLLVYAPTTSPPPPPMEGNFQSNFVNNNLLAPAYQGGAPCLEEFNDECSGQSSAASAVRSPVPVDGDRIKIEQQPSRGGTNCPSSAAYVHKSPLIRHVHLQEESSPPKRHCSSNEQFSVVDQSGVIIRGSFIEIKQEQTQLPPHFHVDRASPEAMTPTESMYDNVHERLLQLKTEIPDEEADLSMLESSGITEEHMIDAMEWWENEKRSASN